MTEHRCQYDVSCWPSHCFMGEFDEGRCCGKIARFTLPDVNEVIWACAEHYDEWLEEP